MKKLNHMVSKQQSKITPLFLREKDDDDVNQSKMAAASKL